MSRILLPMAPELRATPIDMVTQFIIGIEDGVQVDAVMEAGVGSFHPAGEDFERHQANGTRTFSIKVGGGARDIDLGMILALPPETKI